MLLYRASGNRQADKCCSHVGVTSKWSGQLHPGRNEEKKIGATTTLLCGGSWVKSLFNRMLLQLLRQRDKALLGLFCEISLPASAGLTTHFLAVSSDPAASLAKDGECQPMGLEISVSRLKGSCYSLTLPFICSTCLCETFFRL